MTLNNDFLRILQQLGVSVGAAEVKPRPKPAGSLSKILPVEEIQTLYGATCVVQTAYPLDEPYGIQALRFSSLPEILAAWAGAPALTDCAAEDFAFLDTETTGLSTASGVFAFLIGAARYRNGKFILKQFFLRTPEEEPAHLAALDLFLNGTRALVAFNGKAFDIPLLRTRFTLNRMGAFLPNATTLDLLHLARRLWRDRLPSRTLLQIEGQILGVQRTQEDIPGWVIPQLYRDYLATGDARLLKSVFYHNAKDVLAMAALLNHVGALLLDPLNRPETPALDLLGIARLLENLGRVEQAIQVYEAALSANLPPENFWNALQRLSFLHKKQGNWQRATQLWQQAAAAGDVYAFEELAKYEEHHTRNLSAALEWTRGGLEWLRYRGASHPENLLWSSLLQHRLNRLEKKLTPSEKTYDPTQKSPGHC